MTFCISEARYQSTEGRSVLDLARSSETDGSPSRIGLADTGPASRLWLCLLVGVQICPTIGAKPKSAPFHQHSWRCHTLSRVPLTSRPLPCDSGPAAVTVTHLGINIYNRDCRYSRFVLRFACTHRKFRPECLRATPRYPPIPFAP